MVDRTAEIDDKRHSVEEYRPKIPAKKRVTGRFQGQAPFVNDQATECAPDKLVTMSDVTRRT